MRPFHATFFGGLVVCLSFAAPAHGDSPPPPTPAKAAALEELSREAASYEANARDYRSVLSRIVQHHYEDRRRRILTSLDAEVALEKRGLVEAREDAIKKLEAFLVKHTDDAKATPDAMLRLAALYEERARDGNDAAAEAKLLGAAIDLYSKIIRDFPAYREVAAATYHLGHALRDAGREDESQGAFRSLVCHDRYSKIDSPLSRDKRDTYDDPYPDTCRPIPQATVPGEEPRYVAEAWWLIGDHHFNRVDKNADAFEWARAESAYRRSLRYQKQPVHAVATYKLAWTLYKEQRYEASVHAFVDVLREADREQKRTGDPGTDFRTEAASYIASALTYVDFTGPAPDAPFSPRPDAMDTEKDPRAIERKMHVGVDRIQSSALVPQEDGLAPPIYRALVEEYRELGQKRNAIEVAELVLAKWPLHRDAPLVRNEVADLYDALSAEALPGTSDRADLEQRALDARTKLGAYVGTTVWVEANKEDADALETADRLVRTGLRRAAADHTNAGLALYDRAVDARDERERNEIAARAIAEYRLAARGFAGNLEKQEIGAADAYESRFWIADALHRIVALEVLRGEVPPAEDVEAAKKAAISARDSNDDDRFIQPAGFFVVDTAQLALDARYREFDRTSGASGIALRNKVETTVVGGKTEVVKRPMPPEVLAAVNARDDYVRRIPPDRDVAASTSVTYKNAELYAFDAADFHFLYGDLEDAKKRFSDIYPKECGKNTLGHKAWVRLLTIANLTGDGKASRTLSDAIAATPCATNAAERDEERALAGGSRAALDVMDASSAEDRAEKAPAGAARAAAYRDAGSLYEAALDRSPDQDNAPETAAAAARCFERAGELDHAVAILERLVHHYGKKAKAQTIQHAYGSLAEAYAMFFDYPKAASTLRAMAENERFDEPARREAARSAAILYDRLGDRDGLAATLKAARGLNPSDALRAELEFYVASAERTIRAMDAFVAANERSLDAAPFVVRAAHASAMMRREAGDAKAGASCKRAIDAFDKAKLAAGSPEADLAAECAFGAIDDELRAKWDYETGHHRYAGVIDQVKKAYDDDLKTANEVYKPRLEEIIKRYGSRAWSIAARARQASLFASIRTGLYQAREPDLKLYTAREEQRLRDAERSGREDLIELADKFRQERRNAWRTARDRSLEKADEGVVGFAAQAFLWSRAFHVQNAWSDDARRRLSASAALLGDAAIKRYTSSIVDPATKKQFVMQDGMFDARQAGLAAPQGDVTALPLPVAP